MAIKTRILLTSLFLFFFSSTIHASETVSLKVGYLLLSPSGQMSVNQNRLGTKVDLESDLDLDDSGGLMAEAALAFGDIKLSVGYLPISFEGDSVLSRSIIFNGKNYSFNTPVQSSLDINIIDAGLTWFFINLDEVPTRFQLGLELAVKVADVDTSLTAVTLGLSDSASATLPIPTLGLRARIAFSDFIGVAGRIGYMEYNDNHFLDGDVQIEFSPLPVVGLFAGYRYLDVEIDESDVFVDAVFSGFYGGALVRF